MSYIDAIPKSVPKTMLPGLKVGDLVQTTTYSYSQAKGSFETKTLPSRSVGRVKKIFDFGSTTKSHRFLIDIKFDGHPLTNFYTEELVKVKV